MLRISVVNKSTQAVQFQLEGSLVGPWVEELRSLSHEALASQKNVSLDLERVRFIDSSGVALLHDLARKNVCQHNCSQFVSQQLKEVTQ